MFPIKETEAQIETPFLRTLLLLAICLSGVAYGSDDHRNDEHAENNLQEQHGHRDDHSEHADEHDDHDDDPVSITSNIAEQAGIGVARVGPATLEIVTRAFGKLIIPPHRQTHIHARFAGLVKDVSVHVGDRVAEGDVLAVIESNQSLVDYTIQSPISGVVTQRQINPGEVTDDVPILVVVNEDVLWAELKIFPHQRNAVKAGQLAHLVREDRELTARITHIAPSSDGEPFMHAHMTVDNSQRKFTPGELLQAEVVVDKANVPVALENRALQTLEGQQVVFIQEGDTYEPRTVRLGRTDGRFTEVLAGLQAGETYVVDNSYLIKADIEKAGAGHHH